jgi:hypothetical protein
MDYLALKSQVFTVNLALFHYLYKVGKVQSDCSLAVADCSVHSTKCLLTVSK